MQTEMEAQTSGRFPFLPEKKKKGMSLAILKQILDLVHAVSLYKVCALHFTYCHALPPLKKSCYWKNFEEYVITKPFVQPRQSSM